MRARAGFPFSWVTRRIPLLLLGILALICSTGVYVVLSSPAAFSEKHDKLGEFLTEPSVSPQPPSPAQTPSIDVESERIRANLEVILRQAMVEEAKLASETEVRILETWLRYGAFVSLLFILVLAQLFVLRVLKKFSYTTRDLLNIMGLIFIIFAIVFVVLLADTDHQLTAAIGVLGSIAGYLFGSLWTGHNSSKTRGSAAAPDAKLE